MMNSSIKLEKNEKMKSFLKPFAPCAIQKYEVIVFTPSDVEVMTNGLLQPV